MYIETWSSRTRSKYANEPTRHHEETSSAQKAFVRDVQSLVAKSTCITYMSNILPNTINQPKYYL